MHAMRAVNTSKPSRTSNLALLPVGVGVGVVVGVGAAELLVTSLAADVQTQILPSLDTNAAFDTFAKKARQSSLPDEWTSSPNV